MLHQKSCLIEEMNERLSLLPTLEAAKVSLQLQNKELYQQLYENREKYKLIAQQVRELDYQNTLEKATLVETIKNLQLSNSQLLLVCLILLSFVNTQHGFPSVILTS